MTIRKTAMSELNQVCRIYAWARDFMRGSGNPNQWSTAYPPPEIVENDIVTGKSFVCMQDDDIAAVFYFNVGLEPTYAIIDGQWLNDGPYGVVHRIARSEYFKGAGAFCLDWCFEQCGNVRIDTHRDNMPMRRLLDKKCFIYCGIIKLANGKERLAFQKAENYLN